MTMLEKHEPFALGYVIPRPEVVSALMNGAKRDPFSSSAPVNQVDWFHLPSLDLPETILTAEPQVSEFSIEDPHPRLGADAIASFSQAGLISYVRNYVPVLENRPGSYGVLIPGNLSVGRVNDIRATTKSGGAK